MGKNQRGKGAPAVNPRALLTFVSALALVDTVFFTALTPLLPHYVHSLGLSKTSAGVLVAAYPFGTLVGALPGGVLVTRLGVRRAVVLGLFMMSGATLVFGFGTSIVQLDAARLTQGLGGACIWSGGMAWLAAGTPADRRGRAIGVALGVSVAGALVGPILGALASGVGTAPAFAVATFAGICLAVASFKVATPIDAASHSLRKAARALRDPGVSGGMWLTFLAGISFGAIDVLTPLRMSALGGGAVVIAGAFLGAAGVEAVLAPLVGRFADRRGRLAPVKVSLGAAIAVSLLLPLLRPVGVLVVLVVIGLPAYGTLFVPASAMISDGADRHGLHHGLGFGLANLSWASGQAVAATSSGAIAQATGYVPPYVLLAVALMVTLVALQPQSRRLMVRLRPDLGRPQG
ncbi:MAG: MFS transporter [Acidimicrobiales bacterium]|jgi:MFS family permease